MQSMDFSEYKAKVNNKIVQWRTYGSIWVEPISELECLSASTGGALARFQQAPDMRDIHGMMSLRERRLVGKVRFLKIHTDTDIPF